jgi:predicted NBD/HSP70 family sugar kinase
MFGLELRDLALLAVAVDDDGRVVSRAEAPIDSSGRAEDAAFEALGKLVDPPRSTTVLGVAAQSPESPVCQAMIRALATRYAGPFVQTGADGAGGAAAAAEAWVGAARGARHVAFLSAAEHATAGILRDGEPMFGAHRRAPAVSWLALNPVEREDYRKIGCFEAEVASAGIVRRLVWRVKTGDHSSVHDAVGGHLSAITSDHVLAAAREGDGVAISVMRDTAKYLGMAAANLVLVADPEILVLGGIMASAADLLVDSVRSEIARRLPPAMLEPLKIATAALGDDAAAIGAARLAAAAHP